MRAAAIVLVVVVSAGCQPDVTGIRLIISPERVDRVKGADHLQLFVGFGETEVPRGIKVHADDGLMEEIDVQSFAVPFEILLTDNGNYEPFWVGVRAIDRIDGSSFEIVGEGGYPTPLQIVPGAFYEAEITVERTRELDSDTLLAAVMPPCPGFFGAAGVRHHIVHNIDNADCDADGASYQGGTDDCDDFDAAFSPDATDTTCDFVDHTCGTNPASGTGRCVVQDGINRCRLGWVDCQDDQPPPGPATVCTVDAALPLPDAACTACAGLAGFQLLSCLTNNASVIQCAIRHDTTAFCPDPATMPLIDQPSWWHDAGGTSFGGSAQWLPFNDDMSRVYGWVSRSTQPTFAGDTTNEYPPSPAIRVEGNLAALTSVMETRLFLIAPTGDPPELFRVDVTISGNAGTSCPSPPQNACSSWPGP